jgi:hypothetical protein
VSIRRNLVAYAALFVALGGTSYAATELPASSVGTRQLRKGAVTNDKVKRHSLTAAALARGAIPRLDARTVSFASPLGPPCPSSGCPPAAVGTSTTWSVNCPSGTQLVGGGFAIPHPFERDESVSASAPLAEGQGNPPAGSAGGWTATFTITSQQDRLAWGVGEVYARCASTG